MKVKILVLVVAVIFLLTQELHIPDNDEKMTQRRMGIVLSILSLVLLD